MKQFSSFATSWVKLIGTSQKDFHPGMDKHTASMFESQCDGKDQFSDRDLPSPSLSVANNRISRLAVHSSAKATPADLHRTSFQTHSIRMWHGESKNTDVWGLFGLLVQAKYQHLWLPCDYRSNLRDTITKY